MVWLGFVGLGVSGSKSKKVRSLGEMEKVRRAVQSGVAGLEMVGERLRCSAKGGFCCCCCMWLFLKERSLERKDGIFRWISVGGGMVY